MVFDSGTVDIDLHLLGPDGDPETCIDRDHHMLETTVPAGAYHLSWTPLARRTSGTLWTLPIHRLGL